MIFHTAVGCSNHWATKDLWWAGPCTRFMYDMRPAYRRISNVEIVMCVLNKERWQILSSVKKREMMWSTCQEHGMGQRKKRLQFFLSFVAQWLEHPTGMRKVIGSVPIGDSDFFFVPCLWYVDHIISHCLCIETSQWQIQAFKWTGALASKIGFLTLQAFKFGLKIRWGSLVYLWEGHRVPSFLFSCHPKN